jgi:hypothetical protein
LKIKNRNQGPEGVCIKIKVLSVTVIIKGMYKL